MFLTLLFLSRFVANGRSEVNGVSIGQDALFAPGAHQHPQARFLEDVDVVVVGVSHRPARSMSFGLFAVRRVHKLAVVVGPFAKVVKPTHLNNKNLFFSKFSYFINIE